MFLVIDYRLEVQRSERRRELYDFTASERGEDAISVRRSVKREGASDSYNLNAATGSPSGLAVNLRVFKSSPTCSKVKSSLSRLSWYPWGYWSMVREEGERHP